MRVHELHEFLKMFPPEQRQRFRVMKLQLVN